MKIAFLRLWDALRGSYWFIPSVMCIAALFLSQALLPIDRWIESKAAYVPHWMYRGSPEGARAVLTIIASSMLGVAGVVFSISTVALTLASSQFGPRLMRNFIRDRSNQTVLGTFLASFVYCLLVLSAVSTGEHNDFTPRASIAVAVVMALSSLAGFIYFIHHFVTSIQAPEVVNGVSRELAQAIDAFLPRDRDVETRQPDEELLTAFRDHPAEITSERPGYVVALDLKLLRSVAKTHDVTLRVICRPGNFLITGECFVQVLPPYRLNDALKAKARQAISIGRLRSTLQDLEFSLDQLVEVAVRALSPGINDPFTAIHCIDLLSEALGQITHRSFPAPYHFDEDGKLRLVTESLTLDDLLDAAFNQIRQYGGDSPAVMIRILESLDPVITQATRAADLQALANHARIVHETGRANFAAESDRADLETRYRAIEKRLQRKMDEGKLGSA
jgi:uncharacterized membrane protein